MHVHFQITPVQFFPKHYEFRLHLMKEQLARANELQIKNYQNNTTGTMLLNFHYFCSVKDRVSRTVFDFKYGYEVSGDTIFY